MKKNGEDKEAESGSSTESEGDDLKVRSARGGEVGKVIRMRMRGRCIRCC